MLIDRAHDALNRVDSRLFVPGWGPPDTIPQRMGLFQRAPSPSRRVDGRGRRLIASPPVGGRIRNAARPARPSQRLARNDNPRELLASALQFLLEHGDDAAPVWNPDGKVARLCNGIARAPWHSVHRRPADAVTLPVPSHNRVVGRAWRRVVILGVGAVTRRRVFGVLVWALMLIAVVAAPTQAAKGGGGSKNSTRYKVQSTVVPSGPVVQNDGNATYLGTQMSSFIEDASTTNSSGYQDRMYMSVGSTKSGRYLSMADPAGGLPFERCAVAQIDVVSFTTPDWYNALAENESLVGDGTALLQRFSHEERLDHQLGELPERVPRDHTYRAQAVDRVSRRVLRLGAMDGQGSET